MSRTDLDAVTLANILRAMVGDGSMKWVYEPIQASVLLDIADMLDENAKLRDERERLFRANVEKNGEILLLLEENARLKQELEAVGTAAYLYGRTDLADENAKLRELLQDYHRYEHEDCHSCRYINECRADESGRCIAPMRLGERYRELGVEVDK